MKNENLITDNCFHLLDVKANEIPLPKKFTFPFYYEPHPLSILASETLQKELALNSDWNHDFGINESENVNSGKMFGVLVVQDLIGRLGFLKGFSGKLANTPCPKGFVPHVYDLLPGRNFFEIGMEEINVLTAKIESIEKQPEFKTVKEDFLNLNLKAKKDLEATSQSIAKDKVKRKRIRKEQKKVLSEFEFQKLEERLSLESVQRKFYYKHLTEHWENKLYKAKKHTQEFYKEYEQLKQKRKNCSNKLQLKIFEHYEFLNKKGKSQNLLEIFQTIGIQQPPAGAGDCAAPKLLQYAYKMGYEPICMAEFWWGQSPKSEVKKHKNYYPACTGKCEPILTHMLNGLVVDDNPFLSSAKNNLSITKIYEDDALVVVNKPSGLLSVPGKNTKDSVATRMKAEYPSCIGPLIVHRLDMPTSGIMLIAKSLEVHKKLQKQFIERTIKKRYVAILDGDIGADNGRIELPLRVDLENRPYQLVCFEHGKKAVTEFQVISKSNNTTRIQFHPITGRTHQLRMHAAHKDGLNTPIIGDSLYGTISERLLLHAEYIEFTHPITEERMKITAAPDF